MFNMKKILSLGVFLLIANAGFMHAPGGGEAGDGTEELSKIDATIDKVLKKYDAACIDSMNKIANDEKMEFKSKSAKKVINEIVDTTLSKKKQELAKENLSEKINNLTLMLKDIKENINVLGKSFRYGLVPVDEVQAITALAGRYEAKKSEASTLDASYKRRNLQIESLKSELREKQKVNNSKLLKGYMKDLENTLSALNNIMNGNLLLRCLSKGKYPQASVYINVCDIITIVSSDTFDKDAVSTLIQANISGLSILLQNDKDLVGTNRKLNVLLNDIDIAKKTLKDIERLNKKLKTEEQKLTGVQHNIDIVKLLLQKLDSDLCAKKSESNKHYRRMGQFCHYVESAFKTKLQELLNQYLREQKKAEKELAKKQKSQGYVGSFLVAGKDNAGEPEADAAEEDLDKDSDTKDSDAKDKKDGADSKTDEKSAKPAAFGLSTSEKVGIGFGVVAAGVILYTIGKKIVGYFQKKKKPAPVVSSTVKLQSATAANIAAAKATMLAEPVVPAVNPTISVSATSTPVVPAVSSASTPIISTQTTSMPVLPIVGIAAGGIL